MKDHCVALNDMIGKQMKATVYVTDSLITLILFLFSYTQQLIMLQESRNCESN